MNTHPHIDETSDPGNPIFRYRLDQNTEVSFSLAAVDPEKRSRMADIFATNIQLVYELGETRERIRIQKSLHEALML